MKKMATAILLFDMMAGLLLLGLYEMQSRTVAADSRLALSMEGDEVLEAGDVRKIAITFDGDVIIGLSQGIGVVRDGQDRIESMFRENGNIRFGSVLLLSGKESGESPVIFLPQ